VTGAPQKPQASVTACLLCLPNILKQPEVLDLLGFKPLPLSLYLCRLPLLGYGGLAVYEQGTDPHVDVRILLVVVLVLMDAVGKTGLTSPNLLSVGLFARWGRGGRVFKGSSGGMRKLLWKLQLSPGPVMSQ